MSAGVDLGLAAGLEQRLPQRGRRRRIRDELEAELAREPGPQDGGRDAANLHGLMVGLVEKPLLRAVMRETKGNQVRAAQLLGINRNTLRKKLKEHGIDPDAV